MKIDTYDEFQKSIRRIEEVLTLAKFSQLKLSPTKDRVVIYDDSCNMVFDSDTPDFFEDYEMREVLEETACRFSDVTEDSVRTVYVLTY